MNQTPMVDLVGVGLNATDTLIALAEFPTRGSKVEYSTETVMPGGQVATTVAACQTWGLSTRYVGKLGDDDASHLHQREFARLGVEARLIHVPNALSPKSTILVDWDGERTVLCRRDPRMNLQPEELDREWIVNARCLHVDGYDTPAAIRAATWAQEARIPVVADLDEIYPGVEHLIRLVDYLIVSRDFPRRLMAEDSLPRALRAMHALFGNTLTASTLGIDGVLAFDGAAFHHNPAYCVPVADTTGAGDIFHAGFIYALLQPWPTPRALDFSCAAAALNCKSTGARGGIRPLPEIEALIASAHHYPIPADLLEPAT